MRGKFQKGRAISIAFLIAAGLALALSSSTSAQYLPVYGSPTYDPVTKTGYRGGSPSFFSAGNGFAAGLTGFFISGSSKGSRAVRWDATGTAIELGNLGTTANGETNMRVNSVNTAGISVGWATKYVTGTNVGDRALRWDASGTVTELAGLDASNTGVAESGASDINASGMIGGSAEKYVAGVNLGSRPVRWDASGVPLELGILGTDNNGVTSGSVFSMNDTGQAIGMIEKYVAGTLVNNGTPVRWDAAGAVTELGVLGNDTVFAAPRKINSSGTAVGSAWKFVANVEKGQRAVRWDASGSAATELDNLGLTGSGSTNTVASYINSSGTSVGYANKYSGGILQGERPVRWDASGTAVTELQILGTDSNGSTNGRANSINDAGTIVGTLSLYDDANHSIGTHAMMWQPDGSAIDLNSLIDPASGWNLFSAFSINNDNWVTGSATFDPDGPGGQAAYSRMFLIQVPEPAAMALLPLAWLLERPRRSRSK